MVKKHAWMTFASADGRRADAAEYWGATSSRPHRVILPNILWEDKAGDERNWGGWYGICQKEELTAHCWCSNPRDCHVAQYMSWYHHIGHVSGVWRVKSIGGGKWDNTDIMQHKRLVSNHHSQSLGIGDADCRRNQVFKVFKNLLRGKFSPWIETQFRPECYTKITCPHIIYLPRRIPWGNNLTHSCIMTKKLKATSITLS